jgi:hypothetical protein
MSTQEDQSAKTLRRILAQAQQMSDYLEETDEEFVDQESIRAQYQSLLTQLFLVDSNAKNHLPTIPFFSSHTSRAQDVERLAVAFGQMVAYLQTDLEVAPPRQPDISSVGEPIVDLLTILQSRGLGIRWAISAAALSLVEVITNQTLAKLSIDDKGDFDTRLNKVASALKMKGVEIPALMSSGLYKVRSKVVHGGVEPTKEEMETIFVILNSLHEKTK